MRLLQRVIGMSVTLLEATSPSEALEASHESKETRSSRDEPGERYKHLVSGATELVDLQGVRHLHIRRRRCTPDLFASVPLLFGALARQRTNSPHLGILLIAGEVNVVNPGSAAETKGRPPTLD